MNKRLKHSARKRIVIVDDHPLMCDALVRLNSSQTDRIAQALPKTRLMRAGSLPSLSLI